MFATRRKGWIGIEWGTHLLKLAQVERGPGGWRVAAAAVVPRKSTSGEAGEQLALVPAWNATELRAATRGDVRFSGRRVACAMPMHLTEMRQLTIPPGSLAERYAMISNEMAAATDAASAEAFFDFWEADGAVTADVAETVNTLSARGDIVANVTSTLNQAGLACEVLDGLPFAVSRAVGMILGRTHPPVAVLDWGRASSMFCLVRDGLPLFTRHLRNCGLAKLLESVGRALGLPEDDVREVLAKYGFPGDAAGDPQAAEIQAVIAEAAQAQLGEIVEELQRTIAYMGTQLVGIVPERLCLTGDGSTVKHAGQIVAGRLHLTVDPLGVATSALPASPGAIALPEFATAIGLSALGWNASVAEAAS